MAFKIKKKEQVNFETPQEMYKDNKKRTINGTLDYQSKMIDLYMEKAYKKKDVAFELPTGSGKTLIGLLIGEFRRRKNKEKVVYLCPTNQLVNQVVDNANNVLGIKVYGFTGKRTDYSAEAKSAFNTANSIAVTNYSSLFNNNSFFKDADVIIFDDAHSSENYISSNWSLSISRRANKEMYLALTEAIRNHLESTQYNRMVNDQPMVEDSLWFDKLPNIKFEQVRDDISPIIDSFVVDTNLKYQWANIKNNLHACNMFLSRNEILIRPYIPPTLTHEAFTNAKQRIYMSATLGESGELERITGVKNIYRLPMVSEWDKKSIGRRFFIFPNVSFNTSMNKDILLEINKTVERSLMLVQDDMTVTRTKEMIEEETDTQVFISKDIEHNKDSFVESKNGIAILANRYDGIDMDGDKCHMLILDNLPDATHLQEKFLTYRMAASVLFNERVRTRIVQAVGRCTRSDVDYAAVCIFGSNFENALLSPKKILDFHPELRAELEFGYNQSEGNESISDLTEMLELFFKRSEEWEEAEEEIISTRDALIEEGYTGTEKDNFEKLKKVAEYEVDYQYAIWTEDYEDALKKVDLILPELDGNSLKGYKGFWNYIAGYLAYKIYNSGQKAYLDVSRDYFKQASKTTKSINWFNKLLDEETKSDIYSEEGGLYDVIERIEEQILKDGGARNKRRFESKAKEVLFLLNSNDGNDFELGHQKLGEMLGYISSNASGEAEPDPWWITNDKHCVVSEDKIYEKEDKLIPVKHVRQAGTHKMWIQEKVDNLDSNATIETIMITNTKFIEEAAAVYGKNIYYVNRQQFVSWATKAINALRILRRSFRESGDLLWREEAAKILTESQVTPKDFREFIRNVRLSDLQNKS